MLEYLDNVEKKWTNFDLIKFYKYTKTHNIKEAFAYLNNETPKEESNVDKAFILLWNTYPNEVHNGKGGFRILRAKGIESKDFKTCRLKYEKETKGKPWLYETIQKALEKQVELEKIANGMMYMPQMEVWLNNSIWERYIGNFKHENKERISGI